MDAEDIVRDHYGDDDLEPRVIAALRRAGADLDALRMEDLAALDHLHAGFGPATDHVLDTLELDASTTLLDVGSGVGGPARAAAARFGCHVAGVDLSPHFVSLARLLTDRLGLSSLVTFDVASATALPHRDASFARAMMNHVGMNIADKAAVFVEVRRVLVPGGRFAVYEQMRTGDGDLAFPLPWADDETSSFVERQERYAELLDDAGFAIDHVEDRTAANATGGPPPTGGLTPLEVFGPGFQDRVVNNIGAAMSGTLGAVLMVARAT